MDATSQPGLTIASLVGVAPMIFSSALCLRALLLGEEFDTDGLEGPNCNEEEASRLQRRLFAAFVHSIDAQSHLLRRAVVTSAIGGTMTLTVWVAILAEKMAR